MNRLTICNLGLACSILMGCAESPTAPLPSASATLLGHSLVELEYFEEIALGAEFGKTSGRVYKWKDALRIKIHGSPTPADLEALGQVVDDLESILGAGRVAVVQERSNVDLWFAPSASFPAIEPNYIAGNLGFVWIRWNGSGAIDRARILISSDGLESRQRAHLIREELTQALGLLQDSDRYPDSVFFGDWSETTRYAPIDETLIRMLYLPEIRAGMTRAEALATIRRALGLA